MAIDTAAKRFSALNISSPWRGISYFPTGTIDGPERQAIAYWYSGVAFGGTPAPVFSGPIPNISHTENTGTHSYALGAYFTGATSYSIAPAVEAGWTFDTVTGELIVDTDAVGVFGTYVVTGTNVTGSDVSNAFSVTVTASTSRPSGGWFDGAYDRELVRRQKARMEQREREEASERIEEPVTREIASLLREQEAKDAKRAELERLGALATKYGKDQAQTEYGERVAAALERAVEQGNYSALEALDREIQHARSDEEMLLLAAALILADQ